MLDMMVFRLQDHFPLRITDWLVSGILTSWGLAVLAADPQVWALPVNAELANLAPQHWWGVIAASLGMVRLTALFINGSLRRSPHVRGLGAFLTLFIWMQLTLGMLSAEFPAISVVVYPWLLLADFYNVLRASQDAKFSDLRARAIQRRPSEDAPATEC